MSQIIPEVSFDDVSGACIVIILISFEIVELAPPSKYVLVAVL